MISPRQSIPELIENMDHTAQKSLQSKLAGIKLLLCDVDGVLTNGTVTIGNGTEFKQFNIQDGLGLRILQQAGILVGWISNRPSTATQQRAEELKIDFLHEQPGSKVEAAEAILNEAGLDWKSVCFIGDDLVDLELLGQVALGVAVANGIQEIREAADLVTRQPGGQGAVRETVELILKAQDKWSELIQRYSKRDS